jgi:putative exosortase-associated protein (TIGR04073 family)
MGARSNHSVIRIACGAVTLAMFVTTFATAAQAQEQTAARKFGRGLAGLTLGILELPGNIVEESRANGALSAMTVGVVMGVAKVPARTVIGAYELLSAPFPLPAGFEPLMSPEFSWQYFESGPSSVAAR